MKIIIIDDVSPYLKQVIKLGEKHKNTLGFFPYGAFIENARRKKIIVALIDNTVAGYTLYNINQKSLLVYIVHLCIDSKYRKKGIAKALIDKISSITQTLSGIRVHCRRDFEASSFWPKVGFVAKGEKPGRAINGTILTIWRYDYGQPSILQYVDDLRIKSKTKAVIDANIFFELNNNNSSLGEVQGLVADWIEEDIELCLTPEIFNEINRNKNQVVRKNTRDRAEKYYIIKSQQDDFFCAYSELRNLYPKHISKNDESDLRQLAHTLASKISFFVTLDERLLKKSDQIFQLFNTKIVRPAQFIIQLDSLIRNSEYQPRKLEGSNINCSRCSEKQYSLIEQVFRNQKNEKKSLFLSELSKYLSSPLEYDINLIDNNGTPIAFIIICHEKDGLINIPLFRVADNQIGSILANHLTFNLILKNSNSKRLLINISDPFLSPEVIKGLIRLGFTYSNSTWIKVNLCGVFFISELIHELKNLEEKYLEHASFFKNLHTFLLGSTTENADEFLKIEKILFPAKIKESRLPCYIVPIRPVWAMNLFDSKLAHQDLFGGDPTLLFNIENVYYRACKPRIIKAPSRILWYITKGDGQIPGLMSMNACSYITEVDVDKPKELFKKNENLGIYKWQDVYDVAHKNVNNNIMSFKFDLTEQFSSNIKKSLINEIWNDEKKCDFYPRTPIEISQELFFRFYQLGRWETRDR